MRRIIITTLTAVLLGTTAMAAVPTFITVQGRLTDSSGAPLPAGSKTFTFRIFPNSGPGGGQLWPAVGGEVQTISTDADGLWVAQVGFVSGLTDQVFTGFARWLEIDVDGATLPRTRLATSPYAFRVSTVDGASGGTIAGSVNVGSKLTVGPSHTNTGLYTFVAGESNTASGDYSSVGGGQSNVASGLDATVGGGRLDTARADYSTVSGGENNSASGPHSVVSGGHLNAASAEGTTVSGGLGNIASRPYATVAGGANNLASGDYSFAAGQLAQAVHPGSFVWSDGNLGSPFPSTAANQFLIHAAGGVGIGTNAPQAKLHVRRGVGSGATAHAQSIAVFDGDGPGQSFISILSPFAEQRGILFGDEFQPAAGGIFFNSAAVTYGFELRTGSNTFAMALDINGFLGIGVSGTSLTHRITLPNNASVTGQGKANAWITYSSRRWKDNIRTIEGALAKVQRLRGVTYDAKDNGAHSIGLIAEEVGEVIPEVVQYEKNGVDAQSIDYGRLVALLVEGMKEQQRRIEELELQVHNLAQ